LAKISTIPLNTVTPPALAIEFGEDPKRVRKWWRAQG